MGKFDGVLIASDMDGTLLDDNHGVGGETIRALEYFTENGGLFALATGRTRPGTAAYRAILPCNTAGVYLNGALLCDERTRGIVFMQGLDAHAPEVAKSVMERFPDVGVEVYLPDSTYVCSMNGTTRAHFQILDIPYTECGIDAIPEPPEQWGKINFTGTHARMERVRDFLQPEEAAYNLTFSTPVYYEMMCECGHKGDGVRRAAEYAGIAPENVCVIGDSMNDLPMLRMAGICFAPENARPEALGLADVVVPDNNHDALAGVVAYLEKRLGGNP